MFTTIQTAAPSGERGKGKPVDLNKYFNSIHEHDFHITLGPINISLHLDSYMLLGKVTLEHHRHQ